MEKKLILKIVFNVILIVSIGWLFYFGIDRTKVVIYYKNMIEQSALAAHDENLKNIIFENTIYSIFSFLSAITELLILFLLDFKGIKYLSESVIKSMNEKKEATAEAKKQKKIEQLEKELNSLKKNER